MYIPTQQNDMNYTHTHTFCWPQDEKEKKTVRNSNGHPNTCLDIV